MIGLKFFFVELNSAIFSLINSQVFLPGFINFFDLIRYTSFILLVRIKATDSTAHSRVHVLEYQLSYEPAE